jgi:Spy/CpxP family protein refolding chaperone
MSEMNFGGRKSPSVSKKTRRAQFADQRRDIKQAEAKERDDYYRSLTPEQKLEKLDRKLGKGVGAVKERARIMLVMEKS